MLKRIVTVMSLLVALAAPGKASASDGEVPETIVAPAIDQMESARKWIEDFIVQKAPPGRPTYYPDSQETEEEARARYKEIAQDIVTVVYDRNITPLFKGPDGRTRTVTFVASVMAHESSFFKHVDLGLGKYARGDNGKAWCLMQVQPFTKAGRTMSWNTKYDRKVRYKDDPADISLGFTGEEMVKNRQSCIIAGLRVLRASMAVCGSNPLTDRLASYASGSCDRGLEASRNRVRTALRWFDTSRNARAAFTDEGVMLGLETFRALTEPAPEAGDVS